MCGRCPPDESRARADSLIENQPGWSTLALDSFKGSFSSVCPACAFRLSCCAAHSLCPSFQIMCIFWKRRQARLGIDDFGRPITSTVEPVAVDERTPLVAPEASG